MAVKTKIQSQQNSNFGRPALCPVFFSVTATLRQLHKLAWTQTEAKITVTKIRQKDVMIFVNTSARFQTDGRKPRNSRRSPKVPASEQRITRVTVRTESRTSQLHFDLPYRLLRSYMCFNLRKPINIYLVLHYAEEQNKKGSN